MKRELKSGDVANREPARLLIPALACNVVSRARCCLRAWARNAVELHSELCTASAYFARVMPIAAFSLRNRDERGAKQIQSECIPMHCLHSGLWGSPLYKAAQFRGAVVVGVVGSGLALDSLWHPLATVATTARATSANAARWIDRRTNMHTSRGRSRHPVEAVTGRPRENPTRTGRPLPCFLPMTRLGRVKIIRAPITSSMPQRTKPVAETASARHPSG